MKLDKVEAKKNWCCNFLREHNLFFPVFPIPQNDQNFLLFLHGNLQMKR